MFKLIFRFQVLPVAVEKIPSLYVAASKTLRRKCPNRRKLKCAQLVRSVFCVSKCLPQFHKILSITGHKQLRDDKRLAHYDGGGSHHHVTMLGVADNNGFFHTLTATGLWRADKCDQRRQTKPLTRSGHHRVEREAIGGVCCLMVSNTYFYPVGVCDF